MIENIILCIGIILGVIHIISGLILINKNRKCTCLTTGKIIDNVQREVRDSDNHYRRYYYSLCEYYVDGIRCVRETKVGSMNPKFEIGQVVQVHYNPKNCHEGYIDGEASYKVLGIVLLVIGFLIGLLLLIFF